MLEQQNRPTFHKERMTRIDVLLRSSAMQAPSYNLNSLHSRVIAAYQSSTVSIGQRRVGSRISG